MKIKRASIPDVLVIKPEKYGDHRGFFSETYNKKLLENAGLAVEFVQDNQSLSAKAGTLRGLHFQAPPFAQDKLVRVINGAIIDVALDIRRNSPTYGQHISEIISANNWKQIFIPKGFAHGFLTTEPDTEVIYKVSNFYAPDCDFGINWNDKNLGINWGIDQEKVTISEKDVVQPYFQDIETPFE